MGKEWSEYPGHFTYVNICNKTLDERSANTLYVFDNYNYDMHNNSLPTYFCCISIFIEALLF